jgi:hypothetical protein
VKKIINDDLYSDNEGVSLGKVGSYVKRFKEQENKRESIPFNPKKNFSLNKDDIEEDTISVPTSTSIKLKKIHVTQDPNVLPEKMTEDNEKIIYVYYYCKFGNLDCDDFNGVKGKIASAINRLYGKSLTPQEALEKLEKHVTPADIVVDTKDEAIPEKTNSTKLPTSPLKSKIGINLEEKTYRYIKGLDTLTEEQKDLLTFVKSENLCFSSNEYDFFLTVEDKSCFDNLFDFDAKEQMVYTMFKEQLGDDYKAKKLVLMSRLLNEDRSETKTKKKK